MPITERTLKRWRKDALRIQTMADAAAGVPDNWSEPILSRTETIELCNHVLRMTQELLDQHLMTERKSTQTKRGE